MKDTYTPRVGRRATASTSVATRAALAQGEDHRELAQVLKRAMQCADIWVAQLLVDGDLITKPADLLLRAGSEGPHVTRVSKRAGTHESSDEEWSWHMLASTGAGTLSRPSLETTLTATSSFCAPKYPSHTFDVAPSPSCVSVSWTKLLLVREAMPGSRSGSRGRLADAVALCARSPDGAGVCCAD